MKDKILRLLMQAYPDYISGEVLSEQLGISRAAIWKHIKALRLEGYNIHSVTNRGYVLVTELKTLNQHALEDIKQDREELDFAHYYDSIDSTNTEAKRMALKNQNQQGLIISAEQTAGKGRLGRTWESKKSEGLWMSLLLRPKVTISAAPVLTLVAATAMCETLIALTHLDVKIKWPNDLVIEQKKVCGILTEMSSELNQLHYVVLGIGVNLSQAAFNQELREKASSLTQMGVEVADKQILKKFLDVFFPYYNDYLAGDVRNVIEFHRSHSATVGKDVKIIEKDQVRHVRAINVDEMGQLIVLNELGEKEAIYAGEVSVRGMEGYI